MLLWSCDTRNEFLGLPELHACLLRLCIVELIFRAILWNVPGHAVTLALNASHISYSIFLLFVEYPHLMCWLLCVLYPHLMNLLFPLCIISAPHELALFSLYHIRTSRTGSFLFVSCSHLMYRRVGSGLSGSRKASPWGEEADDYILQGNDWHSGGISQCQPGAADSGRRPLHSPTPPLAQSPL